MAVKYGGKFIDTFLKGTCNLSEDAVSILLIRDQWNIVGMNNVLHLILLTNEVHSCKHAMSFLLRSSWDFLLHISVVSIYPHFYYCFFSCEIMWCD